MTDVLTPDNVQLSGPRNEGSEPPQTTGASLVEAPNAPVANAVACMTDAAAKVEAYVAAGIAPATRRAYRADLDHFRAWGGTIPATEGQLAAYLAEHATTLTVATLTRRIAAISTAHDAHNLPNPARSPLVRATMRGIRREHGAAQRQAKPLLRDDLFVALASIGDDLKAKRDRALLLIGFAGGFRRSELVAGACIDVERVKQGIVITVRRSKTDQDGVGRKVAIPLGRSKWCPVTALDRWLEAAGIKEGPVFRAVDRHGRLSTSALSPEAVCAVVRQRLEKAGFDAAGYSGHSLRAGLATSAVQAGVSTLKVRAQTGHASDAMLARYVRDGQIFVDNAAGALL